MPWNFDAQLRADAVCDAAVTLLDRGGIEAVSLRKVAGEARMSTGSILHHLESRDRVLGVTAGLVRDRLTEACWPGFRPSTSAAAAALLPTDAGAVRLVRAYLALRGRTHHVEGVSRVFLAEDLREAGGLLAAAGVPGTHTALVAALLLGLRERVHGTRSLSREAALAALLLVVDLLPRDP